ncbi:long-chain acyl-CoA synthetase [Desulfofundulus australicus DSM 11792]|uniref:Long-chain acyl-CoA synthetase n=1 Tax=Desulfofundulus australicus DSM 11792 TaxID=1121425 RepID=A0A1M5AJZ0_9FIRM|nr:AMP-binding protein [Desulfofundulus australicus]SHF30571.1 long-chain acyl-CoA synthetase [Desulfofundulus australicus DSM 11792]
MVPVWYKSWPKGIPRKMACPEVTLPEMVKKLARQIPRREAVNFYGKSISYAQLERMVASFAASLLQLGIGRGDRVCLFMQNCPQYIIALLAVWWIGAVAVTANPMFREGELAYQLNDSGAETVILLDVLYPVLRRILRKTRVRNVIITGYKDFLPEKPELPLHPSLKVPRQFFPGTMEMMELLDCHSEPPAVNLDPQKDLALLQYSSGITGKPKGAMITHANMLFNTACSALWLKAKDGIHLAVLPLFHVTGLVHCMNMPLFTGGTIILLARYDTETVLQAIERYRCTHWVSVAGMNFAVVNYPKVKKYDLSSLKVCVSGGVPIPPEVIRKFKEITGIQLVEGYGLSETISQVAVNPLDKPRPGSVGIPVISTEVKIVDLSDPSREVPPGEMGELMVRGPQVTRGYWNRPEETALLIKDGWLATGDIARMDVDGYIYILGRKNELIKVAGHSVFPQEVERYLGNHPAIAEVAVVGTPDPFWGEIVKAYVVLKREFENRISEIDIISWARQKMPLYKYPRVVEFRRELPKNGDGKILRRILAAESYCNLAGI